MEIIFRTPSPSSTTLVVTSGPKVTDSIKQLREKIGSLREGENRAGLLKLVLILGIQL